MKYIVYILLFFPVWVTAQTYKYIGIEDGLSNRRIFNIQKDAQGYMWFLTNEGMDRYNGKDIKHYKLNKEGKEENVVFPTNKETRDKFEKVILDEYNKLLDKEVSE